MRAMVCVQGTAASDGIVLLRIVGNRRAPMEEDGNDSNENKAGCALRTRLFDAKATYF